MKAINSMRPLKAVMIACAAVAAIFVASPAEARNHDKGHQHGHAKHHNSKVSSHGYKHHHHKRIDTRFCGSHRHHHAHVWHSRNHKDYRCSGHK